MTRPPQGISLLAGDGLHVKNGYMDGLLTPDEVAWRHISGLVCQGQQLYFSEGKDHTIRQLDLGHHQVEPLAGRRGAADDGKVPGLGGLNLPGPMAVLSPYCYVVDTGSHTIKRMRGDGQLEAGPIAGRPGKKDLQDGLGAQAAFNSPADIVADPQGGFLYVADCGNHLIRMVATDGRVKTIPLAVKDPQGLALGPDGTLYVSASKGSVIQALVPQTAHDWDTAWTLRPLAGVANHDGFQNGPGPQARFLSPMGLAITPDGLGLLVADSGNNLIRRITLATGMVDTFAGEALTRQGGWLDGDLASAHFEAPSRLAFAPSGELFVADQNGRAIRRIDLSGQVVTLGAMATRTASGTADGPPEEARFRKPLGLAVNRAGLTYVADRDNHALRAVTPDGEVNTPAGTLGVAGADDGLASEARFTQPSEVAIDAAGKTWILEKPSLKLRTISTHGQVTTSTLKPKCIAACPFGPVNNAGIVVALPVPFSDQVQLGSTRIKYVVGSVEELVTVSINPAALALDAAGHVFVLEDDRDRHRVTLTRYTPPTLADRRWLRAKELTLGPGGSFGKDVGLPVIHGMAADSRGNLFMADTANGVIWEVDPGLTGAMIVAGHYPFQGSPARNGGTSLLSAPLYQPHRLAVTPEDDLIVTCGHALVRITAPGTPAKPWQAPAPATHTAGRPAPRVSAVEVGHEANTLVRSALAARRASMAGGGDDDSDSEDSDFD